MRSSPSLMRRLLCCCQAGIIALVASRHLYSTFIFAIVAIMLLPSLQWHCCYSQAGVVALVTIASLPFLMCWHLCRCHNGVVALVALAPFPMLHRHCHPYCASIIAIILLTSLPSGCMGIATVVAPALLPLSTWQVCAMECGYNYLRLLLYAI
jgi:hypothetical protein